MNGIFLSICSMMRKLLALKLWLYLTLLVNANHTADYNITQPEPGLIFKPIADIEIVSGYWKLVTHINLTTFYEELNYASEIVDETIKQCKESHMLAENYGDICDGLTAELANELREIKDANKYLLPHRAKRGLINLVGTGMKYVFGTMDANDAAECERRFQQMESLGQEIFSDVRLQKTYIKSTIAKLNETDIELNRHSVLVNSLNDEIKILQKLARVDHLYIRTNSLLTYLINYASILISKIHRDQNKIFDIIFSSKQGMIHDSLFNPKDVLKEMQDILPTLKMQQFPFDVLASNLYRIINTGDLNAAQLKDIIIFEIKIPIYLPNNFKLFNVVPVPEKMKDGTYSFLNAEFTNVAISTLSGIYFSMDPNKMSSDCKQIIDNKFLFENQLRNFYIHAFCASLHQYKKTYIRRNVDLASTT